MAERGGRWSMKGGSAEAKADCESALVCVLGTGLGGRLDCLSQSSKSSRWSHSRGGGGGKGFGKGFEIYLYGQREGTIWLCSMSCVENRIYG